MVEHLRNDGDRCHDWDGAGMVLPDPTCEGYAQRSWELAPGCGLGAALAALLPALLMLRSAVRKVAPRHDP